MKEHEIHIRPYLRQWEPYEVCEYFDSNWDVTLAELASMALYSVEEVKEILKGCGQ